MSKVRLYEIRPFKWKLHSKGNWGLDYRAESPFGAIWAKQEKLTGGEWRYSFDFCFQEYYEEGSIKASSLEDAKKIAEKYVMDKLRPFLKLVTKQIKRN